MNITSKFGFNFGENTELFFKLLLEEDFDFKNKSISFDIKRKDDLIEVDLECDSIINLKIASTALIKSLEIIDKTLSV